MMAVMSMRSLLIMLLSLSMGYSQEITPQQPKKLYAVFFQEDNITHEPALRQIEVDYKDTFHIQNEVQEKNGEVLYNITRTRMFVSLDSLLDVPILVVPGMDVGYDEKQDIRSPKWRSTRGHLPTNTPLIYTMIPELLQKEGDISLMVNEATLNNLGLHAPVKDETHFSWHWIVEIIAGVIIAGVIIAVIFFCLIIPTIRGGCLKNRFSSTSCVDPKSVPLNECKGPGFQNNSTAETLV